jgi:hypothetical protein
MDKLTTFNNRQVAYVETMQVKEGVECDVYSFVGDDTEDLAIVRVTEGFKTPLQRILKGTKTTEGYVSGSGKLTVTTKDGTVKTYTFTETKDTDPDPEIEVYVGELMQWSAEGGLSFYEICEPPYEDGRFENLAEKA